VAGTQKGACFVDSLSYTVMAFTYHSNNSAYPEMEIEKPTVIGARKLGILYLTYVLMK
jgi:hypothetical protein